MRSAISNPMRRRPPIRLLGVATSSVLFFLAVVPAGAAPCGGSADGVSVTDGVNALRAAASLPSTCTLETCDVDGNGEITVSDGVQILRAAAGLPSLCDPPGGGCTNIAGPWDVYEIVDLSCTIDGETFEDTLEGEGSIFIEQDGCTISYLVPEVDVVRQGEVSGNTVRISGPFAVGLEGVHLTENQMTATGTIEGDTIDLEGEGVVEGRAEGESFRCRGSSSATFTRVGSAASVRLDQRSNWSTRGSTSTVERRLGVHFGASLR